MKNNFFFFSFLVIPFFSLAQQNSLYSKYLLGDMLTNNFPYNRAMGGASTGLRSVSNINFNNPASYSAIRFTTFETGLYANFSTLHNSNQKFNASYSNISHLAFFFPSAKKWSTGFGLIPFSKTSYDVSEENTDNQLGNIKNEYLGSGGINQLFWGNGVKLGKFSLGANVFYLFGNKRDETSQVFNDTLNIFNNRKINLLTIGDWAWKGGIQFTDTIGKSTLLTLGLSGFTGKKMRARNSIIQERFLGSDGFETVVDTPLKIIDTLNKNTFLPGNLSFGFSLRNKNWVFAADFSYHALSKFKTFNNSDAYNDSWSINMGGEIIPDLKSSTKYFKNVQYRAGIYYTNSFLAVNNASLNDYGITFGVGLPFRRLFSRVNIVTEIGQRGTTSDKLIKENYIKIAVGFTLNDIWFIKRKFD